VAAALRAAEVDVPLRDIALPQRFLEHGSRGEVLASVGLTAQDVARRVTEWAAALPAEPGQPGTGTVSEGGAKGTGAGEGVHSLGRD
jgi:1-deoxy-D-xylulose-5-phosphate synthase